MRLWPLRLPQPQNHHQALQTWQRNLPLARGAYPPLAPLSQARSYIRTRFLKDETEVWSQNAWDHVPPPPGQREHIEAALARQRAAPVPDEDKSKYNDKPARHWDEFYKANQDNFFKKRKWLHLEFPELIATTNLDAGPKTVVEFGCGTGSAIFPLLEGNANPELKIRAYDYSSHAIKLVQRHEMYSSPPAGASIEAAVYDVSRPGLPPNLEPGTADFVLLVFALSALHPEEWATAVRNAHAALKPGGKLLMRDYGRHDMAQLRFRGGRLLDDNFYARGDKTRVYFFELDELALMFTGERARASGAQVDVRETEEDEREASTATVDTPAHEAGASTPAVEVLSPASHSTPSRAQSPADSLSPPHSPVPASALEPAPISLAMALETALDPKTLAAGVAAFEAAEVNPPLPAHHPDRHSPVPSPPELPKEARPGPRIPSPPGRTGPPDTRVPAPAPAGPALEQSAAELAAPIPGLTESVDDAQRELREAEKNVEEANKHAEDMARKYAELTGVDDDAGQRTTLRGPGTASDDMLETMKEESREDLRLEGETQIHPILLENDGTATGKGLFKATQLGVDRRLLVNRKRQLKMYRVWMQVQFEKL